MKWMKITAAVKKDAESLLPVQTDWQVDPDIPVAIVPETVFKAVGVAPAGQRTFFQADGSQVVRKCGQAFFRIEMKTGVAELAMGGPGDKPRLALSTLEACGLDPRKFCLP